MCCVEKKKKKIFKKHKVVKLCMGGFFRKFEKKTITLCYDFTVGTF